MNKHNLSYNLMEAIELRGKTLRQAGFADPECCHPKHWDEAIDFRTSIEMTSIVGYMPDIPLVYEVLGNPPGLRQKVNKGNWKSMYRNYRVYMRQCFEERGPGH